MNSKPDRTSDTRRFVAIARFQDEMHARLAAGKLEAEGVDVDLREHLPYEALGRRAAQLSVPIQDAERAIEILKQTPAKENLIGISPNL